MAAEIVHQAQSYVRALFDRPDAPHHPYHNLNHVVETVQVAKDLAADADLPKPVRHAIQIAAWFRDSCYAYGLVLDESRSRELATEFLHGYHADEDLIELVQRCIAASRSPFVPNELAEEIIYDAAHAVLGRQSYFERMDHLRQEYEAQEGPQSDAEWYRYLLTYFSEHPFITAGAQALLGKQRAENFRALKKALAKAEAAEAQAEAPRLLPLPVPDAENSPVPREFQQQMSFKEVEDLFRISSRNYVDQISISDRKASLIVSTSSIMLSVLLAVLVRHLPEFPYLMVPSLLLILMTATSMIFAILSTQPLGQERSCGTRDMPGGASYMMGSFGSYETEALRFNNVAFERYAQVMRTFLGSTRADAINAMIIETYNVRRILARKLRLLRFSYGFFMYGLGASVLGFLVAILLDNLA